MTLQEHETDGFCLSFWDDSSIESVLNELHITNYSTPCDILYGIIVYSNIGTYLCMRIMSG